MSKQRAVVLSSASPNWGLADLNALLDKGYRVVRVEQFSGAVTAALACLVIVEDEPVPRTPAEARRIMREIFGDAGPKDPE